MSEKGISVVVGVVPPDKPGFTLRLVYDPDITPGLLAYEVGGAIQKAIKRLGKPKPEPKAE